MDALTVEDAVRWVIGHHEGGYADTPGDRGGPTIYGLTLARYARWVGHEVSPVALSRLTVDDVVPILVHDVTAARLDRIPHPTVRLACIDEAIHSGPRRAIESLQRALRTIRVDGVIGPETLAAVERTDPVALLAAVLRERLRRFVRIWRAHPDQRTFAPAWVERVANLLAYAGGQAP